MADHRFEVIICDTGISSYADHLEQHGGWVDFTSEPVCLEQYADSQSILPFA